MTGAAALVSNFARQLLYRRNLPRRASAISIARRRDNAGPGVGKGKTRKID